ncbi:hypothetical protein ACFFRR_002310 [Megaselia abdita]
MNKNKLCRICARKKSLIDVFNPEDKKLIEIIKISTNIEIKRGDKLSKHICKICKEGIEIGYKLTLVKSIENDFKNEVSNELFEVEKVDKYSREKEYYENKDSKEEDISEDKYSKEEDISEEKRDSFKENSETSQHLNNNSLEDMETDKLLVFEEDHDYGESKEVLNEIDPLDLNSYVPVKKSNRSNAVPRLVEIPESTSDENVYIGELKEDLILKFHRKLNKKPTEWKNMIQRGENKKRKNGRAEHKCKVCGKGGFFSESLFIDHSVQHSGEKTYKCRMPGCTQSFATGHSLLMHLRTYYSKFVCELCGSVFTRKKSYSKHMMLHKGIRYKRREKDSRTENDEDIVFAADMERDKLLKYHLKRSTKSTFWKEIVDRKKGDNGREVFHCKNCGAKSNRLESFKVHASKHSGEYNFKCLWPECDKKFFSWPTLSRHLVKFHLKTEFVCETCGTTFNQESSLESHKLVHEVVELGKEIELFDKANASLEELINFHQMYKISPEILNSFTETIEFKFKCKICGDERTNKQDHINHFLNHPGVLPWKCKVLNCSHIFCDFSSLKDHLSSHSDEDINISKKFICKYCPSTFSVENKKNEHQNKHVTLQNEVHVNCYLCESIFFTERFRYSHLQSHHNILLPTLPEDLWFHCDLCNKFFMGKDNIKIHIDNHSKKREHDCQYCSGSFKEMATKVSHEQLHNPENEVLLKCDLCEKSYLNTILLSQHLKKQHGAKYNEKRHSANIPPFICDLCGKIFQTQSGFKYHELDHKGEKLFKCQYCSTSFVRLCHKNNHEKRHKPGSEKLHKCDLCGDTFLTSKSMNSHLKNDHGISVVIEKKTSLEGEEEF